MTQCYNNKRLIALVQAKYLCIMPQVSKGFGSTLRQLINHVSSHMNALEALSLNEPVQDLMFNHVMWPPSNLKRSENVISKQLNAQILQRLLY